MFALLNQYRKKNIYFNRKLHCRYYTQGVVKGAISSCCNKFGFGHICFRMITYFEIFCLAKFQVMTLYDRYYKCLFFLNKIDAD